MVAVSWLITCVRFKPYNLWSAELPVLCAAHKPLISSKQSFGCCYILVGHYACLPVGNATAVAALISASMTLDVSQQDVVAAVLAGNNDTLALLQDGKADDTTSATAANIADAIGSVNLSSHVAAQALEIAIAQSIEEVLQADPGIIIQAAILSNESQAVTPGFIMVSTICSTSLLALAVWYHQCFDAMHLPCSSIGHIRASSVT